MNNHGRSNEPLVSVLVPTHNRRLSLPRALSSVFNQNYQNLEIFVIRDGGEDVFDIVESFDDSRLIFINRQENRGKPFSLNQALAQAKGEYVAYLDDDDIYYPHHISTLVDVLENNTDCQIAYSDLYRVYCRMDSDGNYQVLSKVVDVSRDFNRFVMLYFNHTLHVSLMHRRTLLDKTGPYNEQLNVLIDWDLLRRAVFFTDFCHVHEITGEFYNPIGESDRLSVQRRKDKNEYLSNLMTIRTARPPKPWTKIKDLSIIFIPDSSGENTAKTISLIWRHTFYPYKLYLPLSAGQVEKFGGGMPNLSVVPVDSVDSEGQLVDAVLDKCEGDYIAIVPAGFAIRDFWVEDSLHGLLKNPKPKEGFELEDSTENLRALLVEKGELISARKKYPDLTVYDSLRTDGIRIRRISPEEIPFQFDQLLSQAHSEEQTDPARAAEIYEYIAERYQNGLWIKPRAANAFFNAGNLQRAAQLCRQLNDVRPTVDTLLLEAKVNKKENNIARAIELLEKANQILEGKELLWT